MNRGLTRPFAARKAATGALNLSAFRAFNLRTSADAFERFACPARLNSRDRQGLGTAMLKTITAVMTAAALAALATLFLAPGAPVDAGPLAQPVEAALKACTQKALSLIHISEPTSR